MNRHRNDTKLLRKRFFVFEMGDSIVSTKSGAAACGGVFLALLASATSTTIPTIPFFFFLLPFSITNFQSVFNMEEPTQVKIQDIYTSKIPMAVALHRRGNRWYLVFPRAYGMAEGNKLFACLNDPQPQDGSPDPPSSQFNLNPRFWLRDGKDWDVLWGGWSYIDVEDLLSAETPFLKDSGLRRKVKIGSGKGKEWREVEERLVEVLLKEEQLCQRCAYCGGWEYSYQGDVRYRKVGEGRDARPMYWCGVSFFCYYKVTT